MAPRRVDVRLETSFRSPGSVRGSGYEAAWVGLGNCNDCRGRALLQKINQSQEKEKNEDGGDENLQVLVS